MNVRTAIMRPLRVATFKTPSSSSSLLAARVSRTQQLQAQTRPYSSGQKSATGDFYKRFTRPVLKTALLAIFTYQLIYWAWVKLEQDEIKAEKQAEVARLEKEVKTLHEAQVAAAKQTADVAVDGLPAAGGEDGKKTKSWYKFW